MTMRCYVFSTDRVTFGVVSRTLQDHNFSMTELLEPKVSAIQALGAIDTDCLFMIDLDAKDAAAAMALLPPGVSLIEFGGHESKARTQLSASLYLRKPFAREQIDKVLTRVLLQRAALPPPPAPRQSTDAAEVMTAWQLKLRAIGERREQLRLLLTANAEQLRLLHASTHAQPKTDGKALPTHALHSALIVESDEQSWPQAMRALASKHLLQADFEADGEAAWEALEKSDPAKPGYDVIVMNWELPKLSGLGLFNRLRSSQRWRYLPVVITSKRLQTHDLRLLAEDLAVSLATLPLQDKQFTDALIRAVLGGVLAKEFLADLCALVKASHNAGLTAKADWLKTFEKDDEIVLTALRLAGDEAVRIGELEAARGAYCAAWLLGDRRLSLLTGYAKAMLRLGDSETARRIVGAADALAPHSIERLCLLGESELMLSHFDAAQRHFDKANAIDPDHRKALAGQHAARECQSHQQAHPGQPQTANFASYLNLVGINLSRTGKPKDAYRYYQSALYFVYNRDDQAKVWFNIGICQLRNQDQEEAKLAFKKAYELSDGTMTKAVKYFEEAPAAPTPASAPRTLDYETF